MISHPHNWVFVTGAKLGIYLCPFSHKNWSVGGGFKERYREEEKKTIFIVNANIVFSPRIPNYYTPAWLYFCNWGKIRASCLYVYPEKLLCSSRKNRVLFSFYLSISLPFTPPPLIQFPQMDTQWFHTRTIDFLQIRKNFWLYLRLSVYKIELCSYLAPILGNPTVIELVNIH